MQSPVDIWANIWYYINIKKDCRCGGMADADDSKSSGKPWGFKSLHRHQV